MYRDTKTDIEGRRIGARLAAERDGRTRVGRESIVRATSLRAAVAQLRDIAKANSGRSSRQALVANLMLLRRLGVDEEALDLVVTLVLAQNVDEEMTATINYLASGFLLALLTLRAEGALARSVRRDDRRHAVPSALV